MSGLTRRRLSMIGAMMLAAGLVSVSMATAGGSAAASGTPMSLTEYAIGKPICAPAKRGLLHLLCDPQGNRATRHARCGAVRRRRRRVH